MIDLSAYEIPVFSGVNDISIAPTATKGGNISHFYNKYNNLIAQLETIITDFFFFYYDECA
jgi:hypothetical protein